VACQQQQDGVTLDDLRNIDRHCEPPVEGLMCDLLWADPKMLPGRAPSKVGHVYKKRERGREKAMLVEW